MLDHETPTASLGFVLPNLCIEVPYGAARG